MIDLYVWGGRLRRFKNSPKKFVKNFLDKKAPPIFRLIYGGSNVVFVSNPKAVFSQITDLAKAYDVNSLKINDEYVWPYLRGHLWVGLNDVARGKLDSQKLNPLTLQNGHYTQFSEKFREIAQEKYGAKEAGNLASLEADFLFFPNFNGTEAIQIGKSMYYRLVDPIYEVAKEYSSALKIQVVRSDNENLKAFTDQQLPSQLVLPPRINKSGFAHQLQWRKDLLSKFKRFVPSITLSSISQINAVIDHEFHTRDFYLELLREVRPKVILLYGYHFKAPLISAAHELGIISVDLQHGLQVGWNPLYNNHDELHPEGYQALPDYFAVWGQKEFDNINNVFHSDQHRPILLGNPWLDKLDEFDIELSKQNIEKIAKYDVSILVIMQNQIEVPKLIRELISSTGDDVLWVIRHHPIGERFAKKHFSDNPNILLNEEIDSVVFNVLFKHISMALSEGSALAIEAAHYGVVNIIIGDTGFDNYNFEIKHGHFHYLTSADELPILLEKIKALETPSDYRPFAQVNIRSFLNSLLSSYDSNNKRAVSGRKLVKNESVDDKWNENQVTFLLQSMNFAVDKKDTLKAIELFQELRSVLRKFTNINGLYLQEQALRVKEARIFQRKVAQERENKDSSFGVFMVSDSLGLPRPYETMNDSFGVEYTTTSHFNGNQKSTLRMKTWAQRYFTTTKLLDNWDSIATDSISGCHFVMHLGLNDSSERMFLEKERLVLANMDSELRADILGFVKKHRKKIIETQYNYAYVKLDEFTKNIGLIYEKAIAGGAKSITFVNIVSFPKKHERETPRSQMNTKLYNDALSLFASKMPGVKIIDLDSIVKNQGRSIIMLPDDMHLSHKGHKILSDRILESIQVSN